MATKKKGGSQVRKSANRRKSESLVEIVRGKDEWTVCLAGGDTFILRDTGRLSRLRREANGQKKELTVAPAIKAGEDLTSEELRHYGVLMQNPPTERVGPKR